MRDSSGVGAEEVGVETCEDVMGVDHGNSTSQFCLRPAFPYIYEILVLKILYILLKHITSI